ncbi:MULTISPECIES: hypothetical protein [Rhodococcus erythropolis group]|uniref:Uncharacterized protein n=1 Tax=Rhodococcus erythropolis TaxID=1833 RepID=A0A8I1D804_RHOER|nr:MULTISPECIES: hypothetical protein [Rhodococcus erythropolis group]MBH5144224.1 hypothetical protein [Rhodococcus erythropolis]MDJ0434680.1 hypothetical protein [Rhodococcus qingshengii]QEM25735.1 hypothetical protein D6M20_02540 [Rhodococcus qingshengii]
MPTATAPTRPDTVSDVTDAQLHEFQAILEGEVAEILALAKRAREAAHVTGHVSLFAKSRMHEFVRSPHFQKFLDVLREYSSPDHDVSGWISALYQAKSFDGLSVLLVGVAREIAARRSVGGFLRQLATNRDRRSSAPGKAVAAHPHIARGPNARRSILRSSAGLVSA